MTESGARRAEAADLPELAELVRVCIAELSTQRGGPMWAITDARTEPIEDSIARDLESADALVLCGLYDGVTMGLAVARIVPTSDTQIYTRVTDLFTLPDARHVGVGEAMMDECVSWSRLRGAMAIDAAVLPGTRDAKNFFEGFGLTARALTVSLKL